MKRPKAKRDRETKAMLRTQLADMSVELMKLRDTAGSATAERRRLRVIASMLRRVRNDVLDIEELAQGTTP